MEDLVYLYEHVDALLLIFCRISPVILFLPIVSESSVPKMAITGLCLCLSMCVFLVIDVGAMAYTATLIGYSVVVIKEVITGLIIGYAVRIFFQVYQFVGSMWSMQSGLSMSVSVDPVGGVQVPIIGRFYNLIFSVIFLLSGGYHWFIKTLIETFKWIPINQALFGPHIVWNIVEATSMYILLAFKIAIPILGIIILIDVALGILARTVPQMNMFVIGIPLKMLILFLLMLLLSTLVPTFNTMIIDTLVNTVMNLIDRKSVV